MSDCLWMSHSQGATESSFVEKVRYTSLFLRLHVHSSGQRSHPRENEVNATVFNDDDDDNHNSKTRGSRMEYA